MLYLEQVCPIPLLKQRDLRKSEVWAGRCLFKAGKRYLIEAPSGTGKSTFLHLLYGLRDDYEGLVQLNGIDIKDFKANEWAKIRTSSLSIVFQDLRLFPQLNGLENIQIKNKLTDYKSLDEIHHMAAQMGVIDILEQAVPTLSYGQQQRIVLIRALCQPFDFLLLDEPFSHLDADNVAIARTLIEAELKERGAGLLLVTLGLDYGFRWDYRLKL